jgi:hypothetical protein
MAAKPEHPDKVKRSPIFQLLSDEDRAKDLVVLTGFLDGPEFDDGDKASDYRFKLYSSLTLDKYIEIRWGAIVAIENYTSSDAADPVPNDPKNLERVTIWIERSAEVTLPSFLAGDIAHLYMTHEDAVASLLQSKAQANILLAGGSTGGCGSYAWGGPCPD